MNLYHISSQMPYIIVFSLVVGVFTMTHSIAMMILIITLVSLVSYYEIWRFTKSQFFAYLSIVWLGILSVVYYDYRMLWSVERLMDSYTWTVFAPRLSSTERFVVTQRERSGRYTIAHIDQRDQDFLLYTSQSLRPWDIILTKREPLWRDYYPEVCLWLCGQTRQVLDKGWFDYGRWLYMQWLEWSFYDNSVFVSDHQRLSGLAAVRERFFQRVVEKFENNSTAWLMLGMTIGDKSLIEKARYDQYISSGLVHLIAVSGGNIAIVVLFVGMLLFWVPFYIRQVILIGAIIFYAGIVGDDSSVIRATVMGLLTLIVIFPWRQLSIWRSIAYARCGMLVRDPYYLLYDMWFILSFSAVIGIVWAEKITKRFPPTPQGFLKRISSGHLLHGAQEWQEKIWSLFRRGWSRFISLYIVPTLWAMIWVTPWLLYSMGQINLLSPLVNIAIVPFVPLITVMSFLVPYLPVWLWWDVLIVWCMEYIGWLSMIGTQYGIYLSLADWSKNLLMCGMVGYWVYWIEKE